MKNNKKSHAVKIGIMAKNNNKKNLKEKQVGIQNFVDIYAIRIASCLSSRPKTRTEISAELRDIPIASVYRKIDKLERCEIIRKVTTPSTNKRIRKRQNDLYEIIPKNSVKEIIAALNKECIMK